MSLSPNITVIIAVISIYIIIQFIVGCFLLYKMKSTKLKNLFPLILYFFLNPLELLFLLSPLPYIFFLIIIYVPNLCLILFTKFTFYSDRRSSFRYILVGLVIVKVVDFILKLYIPFSFPMPYKLNQSYLPLYYLYLSLTAASIILSYLWFAYASLSYYNSIKHQNIEPWIKKRYLIIGLSALIISTNSIFYLLIPFNSLSFEELEAFILGVLIVVMTLIFSLGNLIGWIMPQKLKNFFNRNYKPIEDDSFSESELMEKIRRELSKEGI